MDGIVLLLWLAFMDTQSNLDCSYQCRGPFAAGELVKRALYALRTFVICLISCLARGLQLLSSVWPMPLLLVCAALVD